MKTQNDSTKITSDAPVQRRRANDPTRISPSHELTFPIARETEQEVLGIFLLQPDAIQKAIEAGLSEGLFWLQSHKTIFSAMKHVLDKGWTLTPKTLSDYLQGQHALEKVGGMAYIAELIDGSVSGTERLGGMIQQLKDIDYKRLVMRKSAELQKVAGNGASPAEIEEVIESIPRTYTTVQQYSLTSAGLIFRKPAKFGFGFENERLTNFGAKIVSELIEDDGSADERRFFEIEVSLKSTTRRIEVPASKFASMLWPVSEIGAEAIIFPGKTDHARCAIQTLSPNITKRTAYAHTGWRKIEDQWCYLHGAGAITGNGNRSDLSVRLPGSIRAFRLPDPATKKDLKGAYDIITKFLDAFPHHITVPVLGSVFASVLGDPDYSLYLTGQSGSFKSEMTSLSMAFFGADFKRLQLPSNWHSTSNSILDLGFTMKDALCVIDDFAPTGQRMHDDKLHTKAEEVFRAAGNRASKGKLGVDHKQRESKEPRCLYQSSGEDIPKGTSLQARLYIVPIEKGEIGVKELSAAQEKAKSGVYAKSLATFISYVARNYDQIKNQFGIDCVKLRDKLTAGNDGHSRKPTMMAHLLAAWRAWLKAAHDQKLINTQTRDKLWKMIWMTIDKTGNAQKEHQSSLHPADHFLELLRSALFSGHAHLQSVEGDEPQEGRMCGWRNKQPLGECIGCIDGDITYLDPRSSYIVANSQGFRGGEGLAVTQTTMWKRLDERGMIVIKDKHRFNKTRMPRTGNPAIAINTSSIFAVEA